MILELHISQRNQSKRKVTTVAITQTGNALGLTLEAIAELPPGELDSRLAAIDQQFREAGAHYLLRGVAELSRLLSQLESE